MKQNDQQDLRGFAKTGKNEADGSTRPPFECDAASYLPDLDGFDLTEAEKLALLKTLWDTMGAFVHQAFDGTADTPEPGTSHSEEPHDEPR